MPLRLATRAPQAGPLPATDPRARSRSTVPDTDGSRPRRAGHPGAPATPPAGSGDRGRIAWIAGAGSATSHHPARAQIALRCADPFAHAYFGPPSSGKSADWHALVRPGRLIVVDLRDPWLQVEKAMSLFHLLLDALLLSEGAPPGHLLLSIDEAHKLLARNAQNLRRCSS